MSPYQPQSSYTPSPHGRSAAIDATSERARAFIWKTYGWMSVGLGVTGLVSMVIALLSIRTDQYGEMYLTSIGEVVFNPLVYFGSMIGTLLMVFVLSAAINRLSPLLSGLLFFVYAALNGVWLTSIFLVYTTESIGWTFFITAGMFAATSLFGFVTKRDLSGVGSFAFMALIGLILASIVNVFVASTWLYWLISYAGVLIFVALTAYDTQKLRKIGGMGLDADTEARASIHGALTLYLDFINLFLFLLRLFGNRR